MPAALAFILRLMSLVTRATNLSGLLSLTQMAVERILWSGMSS